MVKESRLLVETACFVRVPLGKKKPVVAAFSKYYEVRCGN